MENLVHNFGVYDSECTLFDILSITPVVLTVMIIAFLLYRKMK